MYIYVCVCVCVCVCVYLSSLCNSTLFCHTWSLWTKFTIVPSKARLGNKFLQEWNTLAYFTKLYITLEEFFTLDRTRSCSTFGAIKVQHKITLKYHNGATTQWHSAKLKNATLSKNDTQYNDTVYLALFCCVSLCLKACVQNIVMLCSVGPVWYITKKFNWEVINYHHIWKSTFRPF
jgi:hypothetical protein